MLPLYALVLFAHGLLPGRVNDGPTSYLSQGSIRCLNDLGFEALTSWCRAFGEPLGYPMLSGGPVLGLGALVMHLPGIGSYGAYLATGAAFDALALAGGYGLMRRLGVGPVVALGTAAAYLLSPTVIGLQAFGGTFYGFALLPAYAYADLWVMEALERRRERALVLAVAAYAVVKTGALFMDGYSFVAATLVSAALWLAWLLRRGVPTRRRLGAVAVLFGSTVIALAAYRLYVPASYEPSPVEIFRAMGLDLITLVEPTAWVWPAAALGYAGDHGDLWGDGSNSAYNYAGLACLGLAAFYLVRAPRRRNAVALAAAGLVALVLSLGPSLKVDEARPLRAGFPTYESYLMPEGSATADLPWGPLYTEVPGADAMRATYRWFAVTRLALIALAGLAVARLARAPGRRRLGAALVAGIAVVEILPNLPLYHAAYRANHQDLVQLTDSVGTDLRAATSEGERAFFLSYDGSYNDYLVNYLAAHADLRAYNAGGDKNVLMAQARWPDEILAMASAGATPAEVTTALASGQADVVVAPYFHLRWSAYAWPPPSDMRASAKSTFAPLLSDPRLRAERRTWFAVLRLRERP